MEQIIAILVSIISLKIIAKIILTIALVGLIIYAVSHFSGMNLNQMIGNISGFFSSLSEQLRNSFQK